MAQVPVRQPRFLGEKVPYKEESMQESIQKELGSKYEVESSNGGYIAKAKPVEYISKRDKSKNLKTKSTYVPNEIYISPEGKVQKEIVRGLYMDDTWSDGWSRSPFEKEVTDYEKQSRYTYDKRELKSGRETIKQTSSLEGGQYKERRIIDQTSKEYEISKKEHDLFKTFVGQGRSYAESRILSRMTEQQREARFKAEAMARTDRFSLQGKAITQKHQAQREFEAEYKTSAQKYAGDIVAKQESLRSQKSPFIESPKPNTVQSLRLFTAPPPPTPPSSTRTDMGTPFVMKQKKEFRTPEGAIHSQQPYQYRRGFMVTDMEKYQQQQILESDNVVQRQIDKYRFGYAEQTKQLDFHPILSDVVVPASVGATNIILGTVAHPVQAVKGMFHPIETAKQVRSELTGLTQSKGEVYSLSYLGGSIVGAEVLGRGAKRGWQIVKDSYVKVGTKRKPPEDVFSKESLKDDPKFTLTKSTAESLESFNKGGRSVDVQVAESIIKTPDAYAKPPAKKPPIMESEVLADIQASVPKDSIVYTGGVARRVLTGEGGIRDVDVISKSPKTDAYAVAKRFPDKYEVIQHEKYPEIYRLREKKTRKVVADFDPVHLAEEGLLQQKTSKPKTESTFIDPNTVVKVGDYTVVKSEIMLKSKAIQIVKGKTTPGKPLKQAENIAQLSPDTPILKDHVIVATVSPAKLKGKTVTGKIEKVGLEDPGIYVSPKGQAQGYFTGLNTEIASYSLNPFKNLFGIPTVTEIATRGVRTYPKEIVMKPGFAHLEAYQKSQAGQGYAYITKRSQVGTGDIPRQKFYLKEKTTMSDKDVEPGWRYEAGTKEKESVLFVDERFEYTPKTFIGKLKGFDYYTEYKGRAVAVRDAKLLTDSDVVSPQSQIIPGKKVQAGAEAFDVVMSDGKLSTTTPLSYGKALPFGTLKASESEYSKNPQQASIKVDLGGVQSSPVSRDGTTLSGISRISPTKSVKVSSIKSTKSQVSPVSSPVSPVSSDLSGGSSSGISSGRIFGGSSSGISGGESFGGGSSSGISRGETVPREYIRTVPRPEIKEKQKKESYRVEVRKKGIFKTIAITETPEEAFRIGKFNVEQTASASLRISPVGSSTKVTGIGKGILPLTKFRESKKEPDVFIQRRQFRIGTPGEKREITFKGLQILKGKRRNFL